MNKIYYVLYNVKILDHLLHVARPRRKAIIASLELTMVLQRHSLTVVQVSFLNN